MHPVNWVIIGAYLVYVVVDGVRRTKGTKEIQGYFLANRSLPWWVVGLSVMATQLSAITMIGTTGQGATDGMRFVQFYFGLPVAMVILGVTLVPFLHGARVFTAYEYLERRFDAKTRSLTSFLFLMSRGMAVGAIIAAPAIVFSAMFGWELAWAVVIIGVPTVLYTMIGGVQAVAWVDVKQIALIVAALLAIVVVLLVQMPVTPDDALRIAGATGRLRVFDFSFDVNETYTFWSGVLGGTFLMLAYFGTDQSQVQRYLAARSVDAARTSLLMSAYWKIPLQALVLLVGVLVFVYYLFRPAPLLFNPADESRVQAAEPAAYQQLQTRYAEVVGRRDTVARRAADARDGGDGETAAAALAAFRVAEADVQRVRHDALALAGRVAGDTLDPRDPEQVRKLVSRDVNYIIPRFALHELPVGLAGVFIAAVLAAAMSSIAAEFNSLSTVTVIDFYRRWVRREASDRHFLVVSKLATGLWGAFACAVAVYAATLGSLIEVVNRFGSFFYGSILGVFLLAMVPFARPRGAFVGLIAGMAAVAGVTFGAPSVSFLWHNVIGALVVVGVGTLLSTVGRPRAAGGGHGRPSTAR